jgi:cell wall-associated NlpC family hydrolase
VREAHERQVDGHLSGVLEGPSLSGTTRRSAVALTVLGVLIAPVVGATAAAASPAAISTEATSIEVAPQPVAPAATVTTLATRQRAIHPGQRARLLAAVNTAGPRRPVARATVTLQVATSKGWRTVSRAVTGKTGSVAFTVAPTKVTRYRVAAPATSSYRASVARSLTVKVTPWPGEVRRHKVVVAAAKQVGKPYVYGAIGPRAFDCSGLTSYAYRTAGVSLPHNADAQKRYGRSVSRAAAKPGDLVLFLSGGYAYHVGIYAGGGEFYEANVPGQPIGKHRIWSSAVQFRRVIG